MITIEKITIRQDVEVDNEQARINLKKLLAEILKVDPGRIEMRYEDRSGEPKPFKGGL